MKTFQAVCRFCGIDTGYRVEWPDEVPQEVVDTKIAELEAQCVDTRCDTHQAEHGDYNDMEREFKRDISPDPAEWERFIEKAEYKRGKFNIEVAKEKEKREQERLQKLNNH